MPLFAANPVVMRNRVVNGIDPPEIGVVHAVLASGAPMRFLPELRFEHCSHFAKSIHRRQRELAAFLLKRLARILVHQRVENQAGHLLQFGHDAVQVLARTDHRPEVAFDIHAFELGKRRIGHHLQRFAGRIGKEMQMRARQGAIRVVDRCRDKPLH